MNWARQAFSGGLSSYMSSPFGSSDRIGRPKVNVQALTSEELKLQRHTTELPANSHLDLWVEAGSGK